MTEQKANEIFRTKYPEGEICPPYTTSAGSKYWVMFNPKGKVYYYAAGSYAELLNRLGFKVTYRHIVTQMEESLKSYEEELKHALNGEIDNIFVNPDDEEHVKEYIGFLEKDVEMYREKVRKYNEEYYIDEI